MTLNQFKTAAAIYIDREFTTKIDGISKWLVGLAAGAYLAKLDVIVNNNRAMLEGLGVLLPDGNIDIDTAYRLIKEQATKQGKVTQEIPMLGKFTFSAEDVDTFYRICREVMQVENYQENIPSD